MAGASVVLFLLASMLLPGLAGADAVEEFEGSWVDRALELQYELGADLPFVDAPLIGTHNSYNSRAEMGPELSPDDANQRLGIVDQLELGVRSLELDLHRLPDSGGTPRPFICHSKPGGGGCGAVRPLGPVLGAIGGWLRRAGNDDQVLLLYLQDGLEDEETHDDAAATIERKLGELVFRPGGSGCVELPAAELSRADVRAAGKQIVVVSGCGQGEAWQSLAHSWEEHRESRPFDFEDFPGCGPDYERLEYDTRIIRYYEDSTRVGEGSGRVDDGITPDSAAAMARCGVDLLGLDRLEPFDGRLEGSVWSWSPGEPDRGRCALMRLGGVRFPFGRWVSRRCAGLEAPPACLPEEGSTWIVPLRRATPARAERSCARRGTTWSVPRTGYENQLLRLTMREQGIRAALLAYRRRGDVWSALDERP